MLSSVEALISAVAAELLRLLNSASLAGQMARDELRSAGAMGPEEAENHQGIIVRALRFLAGYGFFIDWA